MRGGFNATLASDSLKSKAYFFPKAEGGFNLIPSRLTLFAGIDGKLVPNTYRSITSENPFAGLVLLRNTVNRFELYGGIKGELSKQTGFIIKTSSSLIENMLFYAHDSSSGNQRTLFEDHKSKLTILGVEVNHQVNEKFRLNLLVNILHYELTVLAQPYSRPEFETKLNATYTIGDKFIFKLDSEYHLYFKFLFYS